MASYTIFDFNKSADLSDWMIVDDVVMGGRSSGKFSIDEDGHGLFEGTVSLENNGGFSSVRHRFPRMEISEYTYVVIRLKGDEKKYQFRIKSSSRDYYSYISSFQTTGDWQEIEIPLSSMYPGFRGRKLDLPNYPGDQIEELSFLIGNKKKEKFQLLLDKIELR